MNGRWIHSFRLTPLFFSIGAAAIFLCAFGFAFPVLFQLGRVLFALLALGTAVDTFLLFRPSMRFSAERHLPNILGLDEDTEVLLRIRYEGSLPLQATVIDELPEQLQIRDFALHGDLETETEFHYRFRPINRGVYGFGDLNLMVESPLHFVRRRVRLPLASDVPVYPNIAAMHRAELRAFSRMNVSHGQKLLFRIGRSYEFEQISPFTEGDDYRTINWRATGKTRELMTNRYRDESSQNLYCIISKGRMMKMAFRHMTYLDYAINATLAMSNVALKKYDKAGLITFSNKIGSALRAENRPGQIRKILDALYAESERSEEPDYDLLYRSVTRLAPNRSMILFFANFESIQALDMALPVLRKISRRHLLIAVLFEDEELADKAARPKKDVEDIYRVTLTRAHLESKNEIAFRLKRNGIHAMVCAPQQLTTEVINKYIEMKTRGLI